MLYLGYGIDFRWNTAIDHYAYASYKCVVACIRWHCWITTADNLLRAAIMSAAKSDFAVHCKNAHMSRASIGFAWRPHTATPRVLSTNPTSNNECLKFKKSQIFPRPSQFDRKLSTSFVGNLYAWRNLTAQCRLRLLAGCRSFAADIVWQWHTSFVSKES